MPLDRPAVTDRLRRFDFSGVFTQELGWDFPPAGVLTIPVGEEAYTLQPVAQKRGMVAYHVLPSAAVGEPLPDQARRRRVEREVAKSVREHFLVFTDAARTLQTWQWVRREPGRPLACREVTWRLPEGDRAAEPLLQRLAGITFSLDEENDTTLPVVTARARQAFDLETVTKRFYERFKAEHAAFLAFLQGIPDTGLARWYASVMLNRLMFLYFVQKKGFLGGEIDYLPRRLAAATAAGKNFYRDFLCPLFFDGLARRPGDRLPGTDALLGDVPYLNGGIFERHQVETLHGDGITVANAAFEKLFAFFGEWNWHLDERPLRANNEINPDVLGYIFEKYINQKQMGAYYTKEDITEYISKNCLVPALLDAVRADYRHAFKGEHAVWALLAENPDRYLYPAVLYGMKHELPSDVAAGLNDVSRRAGWNRPAPAEYALPTETWREAIARRGRCAVLRQRLAGGEIRDANALVTANLDLRQFAQDVVENADAGLLSVCYDRLRGLSVLDPTCGSGAFLFAALLVLEPLYAACLERMAVFVDEWRSVAAAGKKPPHPNYLKKFEAVLADAAGRPSRRYFILKQIITGNLYGVDLMEEAVEICKLRLFLKLVAQVEPDPSKPNHGIEPLPDMDFNVRAGNTLVGYATRAEVRRAMTDFGDGQMRLGVEDELQSFARFGDRCEDLDRALKFFREQQTVHGGTVLPADKQALREQLGVLETELNRYLAKDYGVRLERPDEVEQWRKSHRPFHWFVEFHDIMERGGFDVIVGNPPYIELKEVTEYKLLGYNCASSGNLYALILERCSTLCSHQAWSGFIVPVSSISTERYLSLQYLLAKSNLHFSSYDDRPSRLFDGLEHIRLTIHLINHSPSPQRYGTRYHKWAAVERDTLLNTITYQRVDPAPLEGALSKDSIVDRVACLW